MRQTKTVRAQQNTCNAQTRKVKQFCHLTRKGPLLEKISKHLSDLTGMGPFLKKQMSSLKKGTAPNQTDCCVISQERDCFLNRQRPKQNCRNRSQNASGSLEPCHNMWHGFATRDSDRRGVLYLSKRGQAVL